LHTAAWTLGLLLALLSRGLCGARLTLCLLSCTCLRLGLLSRARLRLGLCLGLLRTGLLG
jgi:hypothetical protein